MIDDMLYQLIITRPNNSKNSWVINIAQVKEPSNILGSSLPFRTIKDARIAADKDYPTLHWVNGRKAYLKALED